MRPETEIFKPSQKINKQLMDLSPLSPAVLLCIYLYRGQNFPNSILNFGAAFFFIMLIDNFQEKPEDLCPFFLVVFQELNHLDCCSEGIPHEDS